MIDGRSRLLIRRGGLGAAVVGFGLALGPLLSACASGGGAVEDPELDALTHVPDSVFIVVKNHHRLDVNVYATYLSSRQFLGVVTSNNTGEYAVRASLAESSGFRVAADPIGSSGTYVTDEILVRRGDVVEVTIQYPLQQSFYTVY